MLHALLHSCDDLINANGACWILALDAILFIPLVFALFFYPVAVLTWVVAGAVLTLAAFAVVRVVQARRRHA